MKEAYFKAIEQVALPKRKRAQLQLALRPGRKLVSGFAYGAWFIHKQPKTTVPHPFHVSHIPSGLGVGHLPTLELAERYIKALLHANLPTEWKSREELGDVNFAKALQIMQAHHQEEAPAPEYFTTLTPRSRCLVSGGSSSIWSAL